MSLLLAAGSTGVEVNATSQSLVLTTYPANVALDINVNATRQALVLTTFQANVALDLNINATSQALVLTQHQANVALDINVNATRQVLALTTHQATVSLDINVQAGFQALALTAYPATVDVPVVVPVVAEQVYSGGWESYLKYDKARRKRLLDREELEKEIEQQKQAIEKEQKELESKQASQRLDDQINVIDHSIKASEILISKLEDGLIKLLILKQLEAEQDRIVATRRRNNLVMLLAA